MLMQERIANIAYNISNGLCDPVSDQSAPVHITIGDGGNLEGLVYEYVFFTFFFWSHTSIFLRSTNI